MCRHQLICAPFQALIILIDIPCARESIIRTEYSWSYREFQNTPGHTGYYRILQGTQGITEYSRAYKALQNTPGHTGHCEYSRAYKALQNTPGNTGLYRLLQGIQAFTEYSREYRPLQNAPRHESRATTLNIM